MSRVRNVRSAGAWVGLLVVTLTPAAAWGLSEAIDPPPPPEAVVASEADAFVALAHAVAAVDARDVQALCETGGVCDGILSSNALHGAPWPDGPPSVVFSSRFEGGPGRGSGWVLTVCTPSAAGTPPTDVWVYDFPGAVDVGNPVYWGGVRFDPASDLGAPTTC
jgi:hypothetical protein